MSELMSNFSEGNIFNSDCLNINISYIVFETIVAIAAVIGNGIIIILFFRRNNLRTIQNYPIISLSAADFLLGLLGIPLAVLVSEFCRYKLTETVKFNN